MAKALSDYSEVLIVGGGHGGAQAAIALRQNGFDGRLTIIGREHEPPYERPPLSKEYLAQEKPFERLFIRPLTFWEEKEVHLCLGQTVTNVAPRGKHVTLSDGRRHGFSKLIWAAGGEPRRLTCPGSNLDGIYQIRSRTDVDRLIMELEAGAKRVVIIGGGFIGLEAAAVAIKLGLSVTLLETLPRILERVAGKQLSEFYEAQHRAHGVDLRTGVAVDHIVGDGRVSAVVLSCGTRLECDLIIVGIGIVPSVAPLIDAGAAGTNGVNVDQECRTSLSDIYAIGDCAAHASAFANGEVIRLESVQNANDMASAAAKSICGHPQPYTAIPWFWSNQYDLKLQTVGLSRGYDGTVLRGDPATKSFSVIYLKQKRIIAIDAVNAVKDYVQGKKLIEACVAIPRHALSDTSVPLKTLLESMSG